MSDLALSPTLAPVAPGAGARLRWAVSDIRTVTWRNLMHIVRVPEAFFFSALQPIMFVLLFRFVFAGAISAPGGSYVNYLMPGIFVQTVCFGAVSTAIGLSEDLHSGMLERFRALPMSRSAVLGGRTTADLVRNGFVIVLMTVVGLIVGFRPQAAPLDYLMACLVMLLFAYSLMWGFAVIGLTAPTAETAQLMSFPVLFPLTFCSSAFVPVQTMPGWLQPFAANQPVSQAVDAARYLMLGGVYHQYADSLWKSIAWSVGLLVILAPFAVRRYRRLV
jgi:ABC-2 type transport system permease protein/oleandomycin transport system permease protein